ncbi:MAG TPA: DUF2161 family putative PD-(D/E)XK-type phosphodiesterase [Mesorhizobium sp.]|nr:DUF2161 family putative PD-(D/E)XK-type phosphodiesterase [Mesorhizobium sp.]
MPETSLYPPVKRFLERLGFSVKGEVGSCDVLALGDGPDGLVVVCELKSRFNLELLLQGVDRLTVADEVWLAAKLSPRGRGREADPRFRALCRRLGFGLLGVDARGAVHILLSPTANPPRRDPKRRSRLVDEHNRRKGDPTAGGGTKKPVMTAYRQQALACAQALAGGPKRPKELKPEWPDAPAILLRNVYGWFTRTGRGIYELSASGREALAAHRKEMT